MRGALFVLLAGCQPDETPPTTGVDGACGLASAQEACPECSDGPWTCSYDDVSVTALSCGGCQARAELYATLCDAGENDVADTIEALTVCAPVTCEVVYDCACAAQCVAATGTVETCYPAPTCTPGEPPSACGWTGAECAFE